MNARSLNLIILLASLAGAPGCNTASQHGAITSGERRAAPVQAPSAPETMEIPDGCIAVTGAVSRSGLYALPHQGTLTARRTVAAAQAAPHVSRVLVFGRGEAEPRATIDLADTLGADEPLRQGDRVVVQGQPLN